MYKIQKGNLPYMLQMVGMFTMFFSGALLFVSAPSLFSSKPHLNLNSIPSIFLSVLLFLFGYWLSRLFPAVKIARNGLRCKRMYFYGLVKWSEMDSILELKNGMMALSISRKGSPLINGLFFEWLTGKVLHQDSPVILFTPEFFGGNKAVPQEILANTPATCGANVYLTEKINGIGFINPSRFSIQNSDNEVRITIPGKKNILEAILFAPMALLGSYYAGHVIYFFAIINLGAILAAFQGPWDSRTYSIFAVLDIITLLIIGFMLFWIWFVVAITTRHMAGKEIIEASKEALVITRQVLWLNKRSQFPFSAIAQLRVDKIKPRLLIAFYQAFQSSLGRNGIIAFEHNEKTVRFGLDISEDEGNYLLTMIQSRTDK